MPKVLSVVNWPDFDDEVDEQEVQDALDVLAVTDFPILVAFLGIPACGDEVPALGAVRESLGLGDAEVEATFRCFSARSYGGRVCEFRGSLSPELPPDRLSQLVTLLQSRLDGRLAGGPQLELFLQPGEEDGEAMLFVFARGDLPQTEAESSESDRLAVALLGAVTLALCCYEVIESFPEVEEESALLALLRLAPLAAGVAARRQAAGLHGVELQEVPLPSWSAGQLGSAWSPIGFPSSRDDALATAAAAPMTTLLVSSFFAAYGAWRTTEDVQSGAEVSQMSVAEMPAMLAAILGYEVPRPAAEEPLVTLASGSLPEPGGPGGSLVPADIFLAGGSLGLTVAAVSLLPVTGFDGHSVARAAFGPRAAATLEFAALVWLCLEGVREDARGYFINEVLLVWLVQCFLRSLRGDTMPPKDAVTPPGPERCAAAALLLTLGAALLLQPPGPA